MPKYLRSIYFTGYLTDVVDIERNTSSEHEIDFDDIHEIIYSDIQGNAIDNTLVKERIEAAYRKSTDDTSGN